MASVKHTITIIHRDNDPEQELLFSHTATDGSDLGDLTAGDPFRVKPGEKVEWTTELGNFAILFKGEAPFNGNVVSMGAEKGETTSARVAKRLGGNAGHPILTSFSYAATVIEGEDELAVATTIDPLMEISDAGGG